MFGSFAGRVCQEAHTVQSLLQPGQDPPTEVHTLEAPGLWNGALHTPAQQRQPSKQDYFDHSPSVVRRQSVGPSRLVSRPSAERRPSSLVCPSVRRPLSVVRSSALHRPSSLVRRSSSVVRPLTAVPVVLVRPSVRPQLEPSQHTSEIHETVM